MNQTKLIIIKPPASLFLLNKLHRNVWQACLSVLTHVSSWLSRLEVDTSRYYS